MAWPASNKISTRHALLAALLRTSCMKAGIYMLLVHEFATIAISNILMRNAAEACALLPQVVWATCSYWRHE